MFDVDQLPLLGETQTDSDTGCIRDNGYSGNENVMRYTVKKTAIKRLIVFISCVMLLLSR